MTNRPNLGDVDNVLEIGQVKSWPKMYYSCSLFSWPFSEPLKTLLTESVFERQIRCESSIEKEIANIIMTVVD